MAHAWNILSLLLGGGRHQRAGSTEEDIAQFAALHFFEQMATQYRG